MDKNNTKNTIAVCCATLRELSVLEPMDAICQKANELGFCVQIFQSFEEIDGDKEVYEGEESVFDLINYDNLCGVIIFGERIKDQGIIDKLISNAHDHHLPVVSFDRKIDNCFNVTFDYENAFELIARHVVEHHQAKKIFVMAGMRNNSFTEDRLNAVRRVMSENGLTLSDDDIAYGEFWDYPTKLAMEAFFESGHEMPDAFIAMNDTMATVVIDEVQRHGYTVPTDVIVTGFDGIYLADRFVPKITTARQQFDAAGKKSVEIINDYISGTCTKCYDTCIPFAMLMRQSCGCVDLDISGVTDNIRDLYSNFETSKRFGSYMDEMARRITSKDSILDVAYEAEGYSHFVDAHHRMLFCIEKDYLKIDNNYFINELNGGDDPNNDMVVLVDTTYPKENTLVKKEFSKLDLLPGLEAFQKDTPNIIIVPIHSGAEIYGHIIMDYISGDKNIYKTKLFVNKISNMLYIHKQRKLLSNMKDQLEKMYITDPMTGLYNRRGFYQKYDELKIGKSNEIATLISVDLDDLKIINDTFGHQEGDFAIKTLGDALAEIAGINGISARFGGDEFVTLLFDTELCEDISTSLYERLSKILTGKKESENKPYDLRCSLGAVQIKWSEMGDIEPIINRSDRYLYEMKRHHHEGKNDRRRRE